MLTERSVYASVLVPSQGAEGGCSRCPTTLRADGRTTADPAGATFLGRMSAGRARPGPPLLERPGGLRARSSRALARRAVRLGAPRRLKIASRRRHPVTWPVDKAALIADGLKPEKGATLQLYNYADYIGPERRQGVREEVRRLRRQGAGLDVQRHRRGADQDPRPATSRFDIYFPSYDQIAKMVTAKLIRPLNHELHPQHRQRLAGVHQPLVRRRLALHRAVHASTRRASAGGPTRSRTTSRGMSQPLRRVLGHGLRPRLAVIDDWHTAMAMVAAARRHHRHQLHEGVATSRRSRTQLLRRCRPTTNPKVTITMYNDLPAGQLDLARCGPATSSTRSTTCPRASARACWRYWFPAGRQGHGRQRPHGDPVAGRRTRCSRTSSSTSCSTRRTRSKTSATSATSRRRTSLTPSEIGQGRLRPEEPPDRGRQAGVVRRGLPAARAAARADAAWHQVWQQFKAGA